MAAEVTPPGEASSNHTCTGVWRILSVSERYAP